MLLFNPSIINPVLQRNSAGKANGFGEVDGGEIVLQHLVPGNVAPLQSVEDCCADYALCQASLSGSFYGTYAAYLPDSFLIAVHHTCAEWRIPVK